jgi:hypothetical protein
VTAVACHKDGRRIAVGTHDGRTLISGGKEAIRLWNLAGPDR